MKLQRMRTASVFTLLFVLKPILAVLVSSIEGEASCLLSAAAGAITADSLTISWTHDCSASALLDIRWRIRGQAMWTDGREVFARENSATIPGLLSAEVYEFEVAEISQDGHDGFQTVFVEIRTTDRATNVVLTAGNVTGTLLVDWNTASDASALGQTISIRSDESQMWGYNLLSSQGPVLPANTSHAVVDNLLPFTIYHVRVNTLFDDERATTSANNVFPARTAASVPEVVQNLRSLNGTSTSLTITWDALQDMTAGGVGLTVQYAVEVADASQDFPDPNPFVLPPGRPPIITLSSLPKGSVFRFRVTAENSAGLRSSPSSILALTTQASLPDPPTAAPRATVDGGSVIVSWERVQGNSATGGIEVDGYRVYSRRTGVGQEAFVLVGAVTSAETTALRVPDGALQLGVAVEFAVTAYNDVGEGARSDVSSSVVPPTAPAMPALTLRIEGASSLAGAAVSVAWNASKLPPGYALGFLVRMRDPGLADFDAGFEISETSGVLDYVYHNLSLGSIYGFTVCPVVADDAPSGCSAEASIETPSSTTPTSVGTAMKLFGGGGTTIEVSWTVPLLGSQVATYNIFQQLVGGAEISVTTVSGAVSAAEVQGALGLSYTHMLQAVMHDGSRSGLSVPSDALFVPPQLPAQTQEPSLALDPSCNTCLLASWTPLSTPAETGGSPILSYQILYTDGVTELTLVVNETSASSLVNLSVISNLQRGFTYRIRSIPINAVGTGPISTYSVGMLLPITAPDQPQNLRTAGPPASPDQVTLEWDVPASGNTGSVTGYVLYTFYYLDDQNTGVALPATVSGSVNQYTVTGLGGGVDYRFRITAENSDGSVSERSEPLDFLTEPVVPLALTSMAIQDNVGEPDVVTRYELLLSWAIPNDLVETGGDYITGISLQYAVDATAVFDENSATWCTNNTGVSPCDADSIGEPSSNGHVGLVSQIVFQVIKGTKYRFRIRARNSIGYGPWSPAFASQPVYTIPSTPPQPKLFPRTTTSMDIQWDYDPNCVRCYTSKDVNGGQTITNLQVQISEAGAPWKLLGTDMPQAAGFGSISNRDASYDAKEISLLIFTLQTDTEYSFRMRASNDNETTWSEYSPHVNATTLQSQAFSNVKAYQSSPASTVMRVEWFEPFDKDTLPSNLQSDSVRVFYGTSASNINRLATLSGLILVPRDLSYADVLNLVPLTTYYFTVMGYDTGTNDQKNATISAASPPADTAAAPPISPDAPNVTTPPSRAMQMAGHMVVSWTIPPEGCTSGSIKTDGSVDGCPRGQRGELTEWRLYARRSENPTFGSAWFTVAGTEATGVADSMDKGALYCFALQAVNSQSESQLSNETCTVVTITPPDVPPTPKMRSASSTAIRISFESPDDFGSIYAVVRQVRVDITPSSSPTAWISYFLTWGTSLILTDLQPASELLFRTAAQNDILDEFSEPSGLLYGRTTPLAPTQVRLGSGLLLSSTVPVTWDEAQAGVGNATVAGYRVTWVATETGEAGEQRCNANARLVGCSLKGLPVTGNYSVSVAATTDPLLLSNFGADSQPALLSTSASSPSLTVPQVSNITWEAAMVTWESSSGGRPIFDQTIQVLPARGTALDPISLPPSPSQYQLVDLGPNLFYRVTVTARNSLGDSVPQTSTAFLTLPAPVPAPSVVAASSSSVGAVDGVAQLATIPPAGEERQPVHLVKMVRTTAAEGSYEQRRRGIQELATWMDADEFDAGLTEFEIRGLPPLTLVEVRMSASNENGWGPWGLLGRGDTMPIAPEVVHVSVLQDTSVTLTWVPPTGAGRIYAILPEQWDGASWILQPAMSVTATSTSPDFASGTATGLDRGTTYRFQVAASREGGSVGDYSPRSNEVTTLTSVPDPGPTPTPSSSTATSVVLEWPTARTTLAVFTGGSTVLRVVLQAKQETDTEWLNEASVSPADALAAGGGGAVSSYEFGGLQSSRFYQFRVRLDNAVGNGTFGAPSQSILTLPGQMSPPTLLAGTTTIVATWAAFTDPTFEAFEVGIAEYTGSNNVWLAWSYRLGGAGETSTAFSDLREDWQYRFTLSVRNSAGWGARSEIALSRTTLDAPPLLEPPLDITSVVDTQATLHWEPTAAEDRQSTLGWRVYACREDTGECLVDEDQLQLCFTEFPQATAHSCDNTISAYTRTGLRKNTRYTFRLALVNPGGAGPLGAASSPFTTQSTFPVRMSAPTATVIDDTRIRVTWTPVTEWNARGGLDMVGYHIFARQSGGSYEEPVTVYPLDVFDASMTEAVFENLPPNTVYLFAIIGENTACTLIFQSILPACCDTFSCSQKSVESAAVATLLAPMPAPRLGSATQTAIRVVWDRPAGTTGNLAEVLVEYRDVDRPSKDSIDTWAAEYLPGTSVEYWIQGLRANNRYNVRLRGIDQAGRWGDYGPISILISKPEPVAAVNITSVEATTVSLAWGLPLGRKDNILGYNLTVVAQLVTGGTELSYQHAEGSVTEATVTGLTRASRYSFRVDPINAAGHAGTVTETEIVTTQLEDAEASCTLYPTQADSSAGGELLLVRAGDTLRVRGTVTGMVPQHLRVRVQLFGRSDAANSTLELTGLDATLTLAETIAGRALDPNYRVDRPYATSIPYQSLPLADDNSAVGSSLFFLSADTAETVARCELGMARPESANILNSAFPSSTIISPYGWCRLMSFSDEHTDLTGRLLFSPAEGDGGGVRVRARVCGLQPQQTYPLRLHQFGDVRDLPFSAGGISFDLQHVEIDNLGSGQYDTEHTALRMAVETEQLSSLIGRSFLLYGTPDGPARADAPIAACTAGYLDSVVEQIEALSAPCEPCTHLLSHQDSLYAVAERYQVDWVTVWSLNSGLVHPDKGTQPGLSIFYAHPFLLREGETAATVLARFGIADEQGQRLNPGKVLGSMAAGDILCVAPVWRAVVDRMGEPLCNLEFAKLSEEDDEEGVNTTAGLHEGSLDSETGMLVA